MHVDAVVDLRGLGRSLRVLAVLGDAEFGPKLAEIWNVKKRRRNAVENLQQCNVDVPKPSKT